jgi:AcrR family transcriptional regulator
MTETSAPDRRRVTAERNLEAILDAAQMLLQRHEEPTVSAVAAEAGLSRPTVYSHFPHRGELIEALVRRTVTQASEAISEVSPEDGPASDALRRLLPASWQQLALHQEIVHASVAELGADAMRRSHHAARVMIATLVERGQNDGSFRTDLEPGWLVSCFLALTHTAADEVRAGHLSSQDALVALERTIVDLLTAPGR